MGIAKKRNNFKLEATKNHADAPVTMRYTNAKRDKLLSYANQSLETPPPTWHPTTVTLMPRRSAQTTIVHYCVIRQYSNDCPTNAHASAKLLVADHAVSLISNGDVSSTPALPIGAIFAQ